MDREVTFNINLFGINRLIKAWHVQATPILVLPWGIVVLTVDQSCVSYAQCDGCCCKVLVSKVVCQPKLWDIWSR